MYFTQKYKNFINVQKYLPTNKAIKQQYITIIIIILLGSEHSWNNVKCTIKQQELLESCVS